MDSSSLRKHRSGCRHSALLLKGKIAAAASLAGCCRLSVAVDQRDNILDLEAAAAYHGTVIHPLSVIWLAIRMSSIPASAKSLASPSFAHVMPLAELKAYLESRGCPVGEISGCSTASAADHAFQDSVYTEFQVGSYLFMDAAYRGLKDLPFQNQCFPDGLHIVSYHAHKWYPCLSFCAARFLTRISLCLLYTAPAMRA